MRRVVGVVLLAAMLDLAGACAAPSAVPAAAPPARGPLASVRQGMQPADVRRIAGAPTAVKPYITSKAFVPWYSGPDRTRTAYYYKGQGRVIFSGDGAGADSRVLEVQYDPSDPGGPR